VASDVIERTASLRESRVTRAEMSLNWVVGVGTPVERRDQ